MLCICILGTRPLANATDAWSFTRSISMSFNTKRATVKKTSNPWSLCATLSQETPPYTPCFARMVNWSNVHLRDLIASVTPKEIRAKCANTQPLSWTLAVTINAFSSDIRLVWTSRDQKLPVSFIQSSRPQFEFPAKL